MNNICVKSEKNKETYVKPQLEIIVLEEDILTSSNDNMSGGWEPFQ